MKNFDEKDLKVIQGLIPVLRLNLKINWAYDKSNKPIELMKVETENGIYKFTLESDTENYYIIIGKSEAFRKFAQPVSNESHIKNVKSLLNTIEKSLEKEIESLEDENKYWIYGKNKWAKIDFTEDQAYLLSKTLTNCRNCINCSHCENCIDCDNCNYCLNCIKCKDCFYSANLEYCKQCWCSRNLSGCDQIGYSCNTQDKQNTTHIDGNKLIGV